VRTCNYCGYFCSPIRSEYGCPRRYNGCKNGKYGGRVVLLTKVLAGTSELHGGGASLGRSRPPKQYLDLCALAWAVMCLQPWVSSCTGEILGGKLGSRRVPLVDMGIPMPKGASPTPILEFSWKTPWHSFYANLLQFWFLAVLQFGFQASISVLSFVCMCVWKSIKFHEISFYFVNWWCHDRMKCKQHV